MASVPTGTTFFLATAYASPKNTTVVTNATEAVVTCVGHGLTTLDAVEITSGWGRLNRSVFEVTVLTADTFKLNEANTVNLNFFPAGTGIGSFRKVSTLTQITQATSASSSGGDPKTVNYKYIESDVEFSINDGFAATQYTLTLDADSIGTAGYDAMKALTDVQTDTCLKMVARSGARLYMPCTVALNDVPSLNDGQINTVAATFNGNNRPKRYKA